MKALILSCNTGEGYNSNVCGKLPGRIAHMMVRHPVSARAAGFRRVLSFCANPFL
jgi:hypothetical protein